MENNLKTLYFYQFFQCYDLLKNKKYSTTAHKSCFLSCPVFLHDVCIFLYNFIYGHWESCSYYYLLICNTCVYINRLNNILCR